MADHGLRKRTSTTSYTFSLQQSEDLEKAETFNQSYGSQLEETIDHLDENAEEAIEHGHKSKKKKKRKKKKKAKENEDVELQSYVSIKCLISIFIKLNSFPQAEERKSSGKKWKEIEK